MPRTTIIRPVVLLAACAVLLTAAWHAARLPEPTSARPDAKIRAPVASLAALNAHFTPLPPVSDEATEPSLSTHVALQRLPELVNDAAIRPEPPAQFIFLPSPLTDETPAAQSQATAVQTADATDDDCPLPRLISSTTQPEPLPPKAATSGRGPNVASEPAPAPAWEVLPKVEMTVGRGWWDPGVARPLRPDSPPWEIDLDGLLMIALERSEHILAVSLEPQIRETEINRAIAQFDTTAFLDSKWNDLNDPVGNTLTTGGPSRYLDDHWQNRAGVRRMNWLGGQAELAQEMGLRDTNSVFFVPGNQANTRLVMSYTQPLMRGRGRAYNESLVVLAQADTELARRDLERQLQDHFYQVAEGYWRLWLERARLLQQTAAASTTRSLLRELEARREIDVLESHILRARGAMAVRESARQRAELAVRNQEARLWALTGAPELHLARMTELVPQSTPMFEVPDFDRDASVQEALQQRPEITATLQKIRAAQVKLNVASNELMPALNLALQAYAHGLNGGFDVSEAFLNQFTQGAPGYTAGILYEVPLGNAAAQARLRRRQLEARQLALEFEATLKAIAAEVDNVIRDIAAARATASGQHQAMLASRAELDYILGRWRMLPGEDRATSLMIDEALDALDRLVAAEGALAQAQVDYALVLIQFKRATGQLLQIERSGPIAGSEILISRRPTQINVAPPQTR